MMHVTVSRHILAFIKSLAPRVAGLPFRGYKVMDSATAHHSHSHSQAFREPAIATTAAANLLKKKWRT
jgi:hypothetical protein